MEGTVHPPGGTSRWIELGQIRIRLRDADDPQQVLRGLARHLTNQEVADILGVSERTVRRWKRDGRLPVANGGRLNMLELLRWVGSP